MFTQLNAPHRKTIGGKVYRVVTQGLSHKEALLDVKWWRKQDGDVFQYRVVKATADKTHGYAIYARAKAKITKPRPWDRGKRRG